MKIPIDPEDILDNATVEKVDAKLTELKEYAMAFEDDPARNGTKDTLAIAIYYIGPLLDGLNVANKKTLAAIGVKNEKPKDVVIGTYEDFYEMTP